MNANRTDPVLPPNPSAGSLVALIPPRTWSMLMEALGVFLEGTPCDIDLE